MNISKCKWLCKLQQNPVKFVSKKVHLKNGNAAYWYISTQEPSHNWMNLTLRGNAHDRRKARRAILRFVNAKPGDLS